MFVKEPIHEITFPKRSGPNLRKQPQGKALL